MGAQDSAAITSEESGSHPTVARLIGTLLVGVPILLLIIASLGGLSETDVPGLPVVPFATLFALPIDIWIRDIAMAITIGGAIVGGVLAPRPDPRVGRLTSGAALVWLVALASQAVLTVSEVLAMPLGSSFDPTIMWSLLTQTTLGRVILIQFGLVAMVAVLGWVVLDRITGLIVAGACVAAGFLLGFTGHSGISDGHSVATVSLGLHVVSASAWIGGLIATIAVVTARASNSQVVLRRFSVLALICVILLAESGLLNASLRLDGPAALITSPYGAIITAKVCVLIVLIGYGWRQRRRVINRLPAQSTAETLVQLSLWEVAWMGIVIGLSVALSRTAPPAGVVAGDAMSVSSLVLFGLAIPLALRWSITGGSSGPLRSYPEAAALLVVIAMVAFPTAVRSQVLGPQVLATIAIAVLPLVGWLFWSAVDGPHRTMASAIVVVALPAVAWWTERDVPGGLTWTTWVVAGLGMGLVVWFALRRRSNAGQVKAESAKVSA